MKKILPYQINLIVTCKINYREEIEAVRKLLNHLNLTVTQSRRMGMVCVCVSLCVYGEQIKLTDAIDSVKEELTRHYQLIVGCNGEEYNKNYLILGNGKAHELEAFHFTGIVNWF